MPLCKAADLNWRPDPADRAKGVCSDSNLAQTNSTTTSYGDEHWAKLGNNLWQDFILIASKVCSQTVPNEMLCLKTRLDKLWSKKILVICYSNNHLLTNHPQLDLEDLSWNLSYQFSLFWGQRAARWALSENCANSEEKIFQRQSMSYAIASINQRFAIKNSCLSCLALILNLSNPRMRILHAKIWFIGSRL